MMSPEKEMDELDIDETAEPEAEKLNLAIKVDSPSACQRHVTVPIPREAIDRYYEKAFGESMDTAIVYSTEFRNSRPLGKLVTISA